MTAAVLAILGLASCLQREPVGPAVQAGAAALALRADFSGTPVATLVVEVTAPDIPTPLVFNISIANRVAAGTIAVPAGSHRTIVLRAYEAGGVETNIGSVTADIQAGTNPTISILLTPLTNDPPITVTLGSFSVTVQPGTAIVGPGDTVRLTATVLDPIGNPVTDRVTWATLNPAVASVVSTGQGSGRVTGTALGFTTVLALYGGVAAQTAITVTTEPVFKPAENTSLFYDDFEAYGTTADFTTGPNAKYWLLDGNVALATVPGGDFAGGAKYARFDYSNIISANELYTNQHRSPLLDTASEVILTYGFLNTGGFYASKEFIIRNNPGNQRFVLIGLAFTIQPHALQNCWYDANFLPLFPSVPPLVTTPTWSRDGLAPLGGPAPHFLGGTMGYPAAQFLQAGTQVGPQNDGRWHRFTWRFTKQRAGGGTGRLEGWFDGVKFTEYVGDDPSRCEYGQVWTWGASSTIWDGDMYFVGTTSGSPALETPAIVAMDGVRLWIP